MAVVLRQRVVCFAERQQVENLNIVQGGSAFQQRFGQNCRRGTAWVDVDAIPGPDYSDRLIRAGELSPIQFAWIQHQAPPGRGAYSPWFNYIGKSDMKPFCSAPKRGRPYSCTCAAGTHPSWPAMGPPTIAT